MRRVIVKMVVKVAQLFDCKDPFEKIVSLIDNDHSDGYSSDSSDDGWSWSWYNFSKNPAITAMFVKKYINKNWDWAELSEKLPWEFIKNYMKSQPSWKLFTNKLLKPEDLENVIISNPGWYYLSANEEFIARATPEFIERHLDKWNWFSLSANKSISLDFIKGHDYNWSWSGVSHNPNVTPEFVDLYGNKDWSWISLSDNSKFVSLLSIDFVERYIDKWEWTDLSLHLSVDFIEHFEDRMDWHKVSQNPNLTLEFIENNITKPWFFTYLSANPVITIEFVNAHHECRWSSNWLSSNRNIKPEDLQKSRYKCKVELLSNNKWLTAKFVEANIDNRDWNWKLLSANPAITTDLVLKYPQKYWHFYRLTFAHERSAMCIQRHWARYRLQEFFAMVLSVPENHDSVLGRMYPKGGYEYRKAKMELFGE